MLEQAGTHFTHLLPNRFAEKTWKILVNDSVDMEKLKCMAVFKSDSLNDDIFSVTNAEDFIAADPEYDNKELKVSVGSYYLDPEINGDNRIFMISATVNNYKNYSIKNVTARLDFEKTNYIEFLDEKNKQIVYEDKTLSKITGKNKALFTWRVKIMDGIELSDVKYCIKISADDYNDFNDEKTIDTLNLNDISVSTIPGSFIDGIFNKRNISVVIKTYNSDDLHITVKK